jgi:prepilin-type N-terminal cleavage/methylation domain-containing protein
LAARWRRLAAGDEGGFTLIEVIVALVVFALAAQAILAVLAYGVSTSLGVKMYGTAKALAQQQVESMLVRPYHVSAVGSGSTASDLLDTYFPNVTAATSTTGSGYVSSTSNLRGSHDPTSGAFYRVVTASMSSPNSSYSMTVDTQFLQTTSTTAAAVSPSSSYNSATVGSDLPPTQQVGVTVTMGWTLKGTAKSYTVFTQIADTDQMKHNAAAATTGQTVTAQASSSAARLATYSSGAESYIIVGVADAHGSVGTTASASGDAQGGSLDPSTASGVATVVGATNSVGAPADTTTSTTNSSGITLAGDTTCTEGCIGSTRTDAETATVDSGLPVVTSAGTSTGVIGRVLRQGSGSSRTSLGFSVGESSSLANQSTYNLTNGLFYLSDGAAGTDDADGSALVNTSSGTSHSVTSTATALTQRIDAIPTTFISAGTGLVEVTLTSASLSCVASASSRAATATYSGSIAYYGQLSKNTYGYTTITFTYSNGTMTYSNGTGLPSLSSVSVTNKSTLADYFTDWGLAAAPTVTTNSTTDTVTASLAPIFSLTSQPTLTTDSTSQWTLTVGNLSCTAQDAR